MKRVIPIAATLASTINATENNFYNYGVSYEYGNPNNSGI